MRWTNLRIPLLLTALGAAVLFVPSAPVATALCVTILAAGLALVWTSSAPRRPGAAADEDFRIPRLFTALFLGAFAVVSYCSLASGAGLLDRALFLVVGLPVTLPSCGLLALSLLPRPRRLPWPQSPSGLAVGGPLVPPLDSPLVSMILATRNEPFDVVRMTLESVLALEYPQDRLEILITDNSDTSHPDLAPLREYVEALPRRAAVRFLHRDGKEGAKARNLDLALAVAKGDYVLLVDADSTLAPRSLAQAVHHMAAHPRTAHVQFRIGTSNWQRNAFTFCAPYMTDVLIRGVEEMRSTLGFAFNGGHNVLWRRRALDEVAPFEQRFDGVLCQTEDYSASIRAALGGWRCETVGIESWEWSPFDVRSYVKQWYRWGYGAQQGVLQYGRAVLRSDRMTFGAKLAMLMAFLHFLSPTFTIASTLWLSVVPFLGAGAPAGPGCVAFGLAAGSVAMLILYLRSARSHGGASLPARIGGMVFAAVVLFGLTTWTTMLSTFANLRRKELVWTVTAKK